MTKFKKWQEDEHGWWHCQSCDLIWGVSEGNPEENELKYCPKCGIKIEDFIKYNENGD